MQHYLGFKPVVQCVCRHRQNSVKHILPVTDVVQLDGECSMLVKCHPLENNNKEREREGEALQDLRITSKGAPHRYKPSFDAKA